jgi:hypothetical protein
MDQKRSGSLEAGASKTLTVYPTELSGHISVRQPTQGLAYALIRKARIKPSVSV